MIFQEEETGATQHWRALTETKICEGKGRPNIISVKVVTDDPPRKTRTIDQNGDLEKQLHGIAKAEEIPAPYKLRKEGVEIMHKDIGGGGDTIEIIPSTASDAPRGGKQFKRGLVYGKHTEPPCVLVSASLGRSMGDSS
jgi:hypothetical protein